MPQIRRICCQAAFLGAPIDPIFNDLEWFTDVVVVPYLMFEPKYTWVAEVDGALVGYLTGSIKRSFKLLRGQFIVTKVSGLYWRYLFGKYRDHPRSRDFARFVLTEARHNVPKHPNNTPHFHFNVDRDYRGMGIGTSLIARFEEAIKVKGIDSYYAEVMSLQTTERPSSVTLSPSQLIHSEDDFIRMGYKIFDRRSTPIFRQELGDLNILCIVRSLGSAKFSENYSGPQIQDSSLSSTLEQ
nr:MAG: Acetyltransferase (GNAT) family protein [Candidatus Kentron sp. FM]VFJ73574.1 MAG: Acetyltransferase (GNAT) family protein [Candidatus Kentron sp. FM]